MHIYTHTWRSWEEWGEEKESVVAVEERDVHESDRVKESSSLFCPGERNGGKERRIRGRDLAWARHSLDWLMDGWAGLVLG